MVIRSYHPTDLRAGLVAYVYNCRKVSTLVWIIRLLMALALPSLLDTFSSVFSSIVLVIINRTLINRLTEPPPEMEGQV